MNRDPGAVARIQSRPKHVLIAMTAFLTVVALAMTGIVEGTGSAIAGGGSFYGEGNIAANNPASGNVVGVTEADLFFNCEYPPESQGADAYVFQLPDGFGLPAPFTVKGTSDAPYDLDVNFYDAECFELDGAVATESPDESGNVPAETKYVVVNLFLGGDVHVALCVGDPSGCVAGSPTGSASPSSSPSDGPDPEGDQRISIQTGRNLIKFRRVFQLSGRIHGEPQCGPPQTHLVGVSRKVLGSDKWKPLNRAIPVGENGHWKLRVRAAKSARYRASVSPSPTCPPETTGPIVVRVHAKIAKLISTDEGGCGPKKYYGRVKPSYPRTNVRLQKRNEKGKWRGIGESDKLNKKSRFVLKSPSCGSYRVLWPQQAPSNAWGFKRFKREG